MCLSGQVYDGELRGRVDLQRSATAVRLRSADEQLFRVDCGVSRPETKMYESGGSGSGTKLKCLLTDGGVLHMIHISRLPVKSIHQEEILDLEPWADRVTRQKREKKRQVESPLSPSLHYLVYALLTVLHAGFHVNTFVPREGRNVVLPGFFDGGWSVGHKTQGRSLIALSSWSGFSVTSHQAR